MALKFELFVVCAFAIGCALAWDDYSSLDLPVGANIPRDVKVKDDPKPCCLPKQWEGNITGSSSNSKHGPKDGNGVNCGANCGGNSAMVFVDQDNKQVAGKGPAGRFGNETGGFIIKFGSNDTAKAYFFNMNKQKCFTKTLNHAKAHDQCIPANATFRGSINLGPHTGGLAVDSWSFHFGKEGDKGGFFVAGRVLVVRDNCMPVYVEDHGGFWRKHHKPGDDNQVVLDEDYEDRPGPRPGHGGRGGMFSVSSYFSDIVPQIKDPSVFTPPSFCNATVTGEVPPAGYFTDLEDVFAKFVDY